MPTSRTVNATVTALVSSYRKEIQAAAGDATLSKAEERKLSPWLKSHVQQLRQGNKPVTVDGPISGTGDTTTYGYRSIDGQLQRIVEYCHIGPHGGARTRCGPRGHHGQLVSGSEHLDTGQHRAHVIAGGGTGNQLDRF